MDPLQQQLSGVYSTATLIISILLLLWAVNFILGLISKIFVLGKSVGTFYRSFIHRYIRILIYSFLGLFTNKSLREKA
ncbi:hypothetical protein EV10_1181 [Prochlorococcus marinus str. SS51]|nr:hypothetical protein EV04_0846 [Prochlorococcus marinus str. LG]KGG21872.1 hypothetical protein EV08_0477 [Prochlorococcus marinus str. SS2]KGG32067.1 hypothetical protein EV10_1181 [Prochlorococcus marinus str. SS51]